MDKSLERKVFNKNALLENLEIKDFGEIKLVKIINETVKILLTAFANGDIELTGFHSQEKATPGATRCALLYALQYIVDNKDSVYNTINPYTSNIIVSSPSPTDGNLDRLVRIYEEIGFQRKEPRPGIPIVLESTINEIILRLTTQCAEEESYGGSRKRIPYEKRTVKELKGLAVKRKINTSGLTKTDIIAKLRNK